MVVVSMVCFNAVFVLIDRIVVKRKFETNMTMGQLSPLVMNDYYISPYDPRTEGNVHKLDHTTCRASLNTDQGMFNRCY